MFDQGTGVFLQFWSWDQGPAKFGKKAFGLSNSGKIDIVQKNWTAILNRFELAV